MTFDCKLKQSLAITFFVATNIVNIAPTLAADSNANLTAYIETLNANMPPNNDGDAVAALFTEDGIHHGVNQGPPQVGPKEISAFFDGFENTWADWTHVEKSRIVAGDRAMWEGVATGKHKESGKPVELPIVFILEFDDSGLVEEKRVYVDVHLVAEQLE